VSYQNKNIPHIDDYEQALFDELQAQANHVDPDAKLPEPVPASEWLKREADGDEILENLYVAKESIENDRIEQREAGRDSDEYTHTYRLARSALHRAIAQRARDPRIHPK
jgi:hypothetical protein